MMHSGDQRTVFAHPGWRVGFAVVSMLPLGYKVPAGNGIFVAYLLFSWQLLTDYLKFIPKTKLRVAARSIGITCSSILILISFMGMMGILTVAAGAIESGAPDIIVSKAFVVFGGAHFSYTYFWIGSCATIVVLTMVDWLAERREINILAENAVDKAIEDAMLAKKEIQSGKLQASASSEDRDVPGAGQTEGEV